MIRKLLHLGDRNEDTPSQTYNFFMGTRSQDEMLHVAVSEKKEKPVTPVLIPKTYLGLQHTLIHVLQELSDMNI